MHPGSKFNNKKISITINGESVIFDSRLELSRWYILESEQRLGNIGDISIHKKFLLQEGFQEKDGAKHRPIFYEADFSYHDLKSNRMIVEDVKGFRTAVYMLKKKLFMKKYPDLVFRELGSLRPRRINRQRLRRPLRR